MISVVRPQRRLLHDAGLRALTSPPALRRIAAARALFVWSYSARSTAAGASAGTSIVDDEISSLTTSAVIGGGADGWARVARDRGVMHARMGFDTDRLVREFVTLRLVIRDILADGRVAPHDAGSPLADLIDAAIAESVRAYVTACKDEARRVHAENIGFLTHELRISWLLYRPLRTWSAPLSHLHAVARSMRSNRAIDASRSSSWLGLTVARRAIWRREARSTPSPSAVVAVTSGSSSRDADCPLREPRMRLSVSPKGGSNEHPRSIPQWPTRRDPLELGSDAYLR
jgi:hypothetical protein